MIKEYIKSEIFSNQSNSDQHLEVKKSENVELGQIENPYVEENKQETQNGSKENKILENDSFFGMEIILEEEKEWKEVNNRKY
jgi:hypothetical protein